MKNLASLKYKLKKKIHNLNYQPMNSGLAIQLIEINEKLFKTIKENSGRALSKPSSQCKIFYWLHV